MVQLHLVDDTALLGIPPLLEGIQSEPVRESRILQTDQDLVDKCCSCEDMRASNSQGPYSIDPKQHSSYWKDTHTQMGPKIYGSNHVGKPADELSGTAADTLSTAQEEEASQSVVRLDCFV